jgi:arginine decarboxylase
MSKQAKAPILEAIQEFKEKQFTSFACPGHKQGKEVDDRIKGIIGATAFVNDIAMSCGVDDRKESKQVKRGAEKLAAEAYGADDCFFSVNGTSLSMHVAMTAVANHGDAVAIPMNSHKSLIDACIMVGTEPVFVEPEIDEKNGFENGIAPETLKRVLEQRPDIKAVFVVSPTYYGVASNVEELALVAHQHNKIFIVDEAWGPHFRFHPDLPDDGIAAGADISMGSIHKTMNGLGQASVVMCKGKRFDEERLKLAVYMYESTSPSSLIMASIDAARRQMVEHGKELWQNALDMSEKARKAINKIAGLRCIGEEILGTAGAYKMDKTKLVIDVSALNLTGWAAADWLYNEKQVAVELAEERRIMALIGVGENEETISKFLQALQEMTQWAKTAGMKSLLLPPLQKIRPACIVRPRDAFFARTKMVPFASSAGKIAAELVSPYPPGIPRLLPGQLITQDIIDYIRTGIDNGMYVPDCVDQSLNTIRVME